MNVRVVLYVGVLVALCLCAGSVWSAPAKAAPTTYGYVVRAGDGGWWAIAHAHGVPMDRLLAVNHATAATPVRVGQAVKIPGARPSPAKHVVKPAVKKPAHSTTTKPAT